MDTRLNEIPQRHQLRVFLYHNYLYLHLLICPCNHLQFLSGWIQWLIRSASSSNVKVRFTIVTGIKDSTPWGWWTLESSQFEASSLIYLHIMEVALDKYGMTLLFNKNYCGNLCPLIWICVKCFVGRGSKDPLCLPIMAWIHGYRNYSGFIHRLVLGRVKITQVSDYIEPGRMGKLVITMDLGQLSQSFHME